MRARWGVGTALVMLLGAAHTWATPLLPYMMRPARLLVESVSGLTLKKHVPVAELTPEEARAYLSRDLEEDLKGQDLEGQSLLLHAFGYLPTPIDLKAISLNLISSQAAAFYDPRTGAFHNISRFGPTDLLSESVVITHELTHAAQDQARGISAVFEARKEDDDRSRALQWVLEGEATVVGNRAGGILGPPLPGPAGKLWGEATTWVSWTPAYARLAAMGAMMTTSGDAPPPFLTEQLLSPYLDGSRAFWTVEAQLGKRAHVLMVCHPPASTEELLHPEKYLRANDPPVQLGLPPSPNARVRAEMTQGEWALRWLLRQGLDHDVADQAAAGWGGDRMAYDNNGAAVWRLVMDSPKDAAEHAAALRTLPVLPSDKVLLHGDEVHVFNAAGADWAHGMSAAPRTAHAADPGPPPGSLCAGG